MSSTNPETTSSKRKAPDDRVASKAAATQAIHFTARNPPWTYLKLQLYVVYNCSHASSEPY